MAIHSHIKRLGLWPHSGAKAVGRGIVHAMMVGIVAGFGAILFHLLCIAVTHFSLNYLAGYEPGGPANEVEYEDLSGPRPHEVRTAGEVVQVHRPVNLWMLLLVPTVGGLVSGFIVYRFAPEAGGHGTDSAIHAFHHEAGKIRGRVPLVKMLSSAITLGTGGSGGREGPISQIGAGFGSWFATRLGLSDDQRRILMTAGLGAGIGAIFHAPLAGAIFAVEVLYRDPEFESEALIPSFVATTVAYCVFSLAFGFEPLFDIPANLSFEKPILLLPLTVLAVLMAYLSWAYVKCLFMVERRFKKMKISRYLKPGLGAMLSAMIGIGLYLAFSGQGSAAQHHALSVLSIGYGYLQYIINPTDPAGFSILLLLAVGIGKILTTSFTIGSGGSAGTFGPCMVIGGTLGAVVGVLCHRLMPGIVAAQSIPTFAILGMVAFFAAAANTPLAALLVVCEVTAGYKLLLPAMWVCAIAYLLGRGWTLYPTQVPDRSDSPAHSDEFIIDVLKGLTVGNAITQSHRVFSKVPLDMPLFDLSRLVASTVQTCFPVVGPDDRYAGLISIQDIRQFLYESNVGPLAVAHDLATPVKPLTLTTELSSAMKRFALERFDELPVIDEKQPLVILGMLRRLDVIATYDRRLMEVRRPAPLAADA